MPTCVFLSGRFYGCEGSPPISEARISAFDAGLQHAVGLFETMRAGVLRRGIEGPRTHGEAIETWVLMLDDHMERLAGSARELGLSDQLRVPALSEAVVETVRRSGLEHARVRLTITAGDLAMLSGAQGGGGGGGGGIGGGGGAQARQADPTVLIVAQPITEYPAPMFERGVAATLADARANPLDPTHGHKTLNYWWRLRELQTASSKGAAEAIVLSVTNHLVGGCVSNLLIVKDDTLLTPIARAEEQEIAGKGAPALPSPVLPGITRAWAIDKAERLGLRVSRKMLAVQDLLEADEVMLTNSSWGVLPIVRVEASDIGEAKPGRIARDLRDAWLASFPSADEPL